MDRIRTRPWNSRMWLVSYAPTGFAVNGHIGGTFHGFMNDAKRLGQPR
jgi:hypothetical protein